MQSSFHLRSAPLRRSPRAHCSLRALPRRPGPGRRRGSTFWATCSNTGQATTIIDDPLNSARGRQLLAEARRRRVPGCSSCPATGISSSAPISRIALRLQLLAEPALHRTGECKPSCCATATACAPTTSPTRPSAGRCATPAWQAQFLGQPLAVRKQVIAGMRHEERRSQIRKERRNHGRERRGIIALLRGTRRPSSPGSWPHPPPGGSPGRAWTASTRPTPWAGRLAGRKRNSRAEKCWFGLTASSPVNPSE
jgi:hypothetical protein